MEGGIRLAYQELGVVCGGKGSSVCKQVSIMHAKGKDDTYSVRVKLSRHFEKQFYLIISTYTCLQATAFSKGRSCLGLVVNEPGDSLSLSNECAFLPTLNIQTKSIVSF